MAGPYEPAMGELVVNEQYKQRIERCINEHIESFIDKELSQWNIWGQSKYLYSSKYKCFPIPVV